MPAPVSVRNNNPGAMWNGRASRKFGSGTYEKLSDGNRAATFPSSIHGAAAIFYLLDTSYHYRGKTISEAIRTWSGGNHVNAYLSRIEELTRFTRHDYIDDDLLGTEGQAIELAKAMAHHETGYAYPMSDAEWREAYALYQRAKSGERLDIKRERVGPVTKPLEVALSYLGEREIKGVEDNETINRFFDDVGLPHLTDDDAWCAAFVGSVLKEAGCAYMHERADARAYLKYGEELREPEVGALVVMWREDPRSWKGHVGFVKEWTDTHVTIVGGNQSDAVTEMTVPRVGKESKVLGYRRAIPIKLPVRDVVASDSVKYKAAGLLAVVSTFFWSAWQEVAEGVALVWGMLSGLWWDAPKIATEVSAQVGAFQKLSAHAQLPWPAYLSLLIAALAIGLNLYRTWQRKRNRQDDETTPARAG